MTRIGILDLKQVGLLFLALACTSCAPPDFAMPAGPPGYQIGYADGCEAGYVAAGSALASDTVSTEPAQTDEAYIVGWESGFDSCNRSFLRIRRVITSVAVPAP